MNHSKNRLHSVIVIGATPAGVVATNKLGELGIPVTLVDSETDLTGSCPEPIGNWTQGSPSIMLTGPGF